jgi:hypothetical protein
MRSSSQTVVFDACHSGGMERDVAQVRAARFPSSWVPLELDSHLWKGKIEQTVHSHRMWSPSASSHVLLAACREDQTAREIAYNDQSVHGRFTESLITRLGRVALEKTTYTDLLSRLPVWEGQNPHCGGVGRDRLVFNGNYAAAGPLSAPLTLHASPVASATPPIFQSFQVDMGSLEGVIPGTEFAAHAPDGTFLHTLVAYSVELNRAILALRDGQPIALPAEGVSRAEVTDWKNDDMILHVYTPPDFPYTTDLFPMTRLTRNFKQRLFVPAASPEDADILLRSDGKELVIEPRTSTVVGCKRETRLPRLRMHLPTLVDGIAHFNYFLDRHQGRAPIAGVGLEMHRLVGDFPGRTPDRSVGHGGNMIANNEVRFRSEKGAKYGFTIRNNSDEDLFPYLFYFDPSSYSIDVSRTCNLPSTLRSCSLGVVRLPTPHCGLAQEAGRDGDARHGPRARA